MPKRDSRLNWVWVLAILLLLGLGVYLYAMVLRNPPGPVVTKKLSPEDKPPAPLQSPPDASKTLPVSIPERQESALISGPPDEDMCRRLDNTVQDFFRYLDRQNYIQHLDPEIDTFQRFQRVLRNLASRLPIPAGEGIDPQITVENVYHLFRVLDRRDLRLIKEVVRNEQDSLEINLRIFYEWLNLDGECEASAADKPSLKMLYHYAGFFLNTIGGRAYLFRQNPSLRLLISYYSLMIIHKADQKGQNTYGIDVLPFIAPLKREILRYTDFRYQDEYLDTLERLESYYVARR